MIKHCAVYQILLAIITGIFLIGCSGPAFPPDPPLSPNLMDKSTFTGIPCAAPCWHNLTIGESNETNVMATLPTLTFIDQNTVSSLRSSSKLSPDFYAPEVEITAHCIRPGKQCLTLSVVDDILTYIIVVLNYDIELDEAIRYLGDPDYVGYSNLGEELIMCEVFWVWSNKQLILASERFEGYDAEKSNCGAVRQYGKTVSNLKISEARYMSVALIKHILSKPGVFKFSGTMPGK